MSNEVMMLNKMNYRVGRPITQGFEDKNLGSSAGLLGQ